MEKRRASFLIGHHWVYIVEINGCHGEPCFQVVGDFGFQKNVSLYESYHFEICEQWIRDNLKE